MDGKVVAVDGDVSPVVPITREERLRRQKEEEDKRKQREEELADALNAATAEEQPEESADDGLNQLLDKVLGDDFEEVEEDEEEGPSDEDLMNVEEEDN